MFFSLFFLILLLHLFFFAAFLFRCCCRCLPLPVYVKIMTSAGQRKRIYLYLDIRVYLHVLCKTRSTLWPSLLMPDPSFSLFYFRFATDRFGLFPGLTLLLFSPSQRHVISARLDTYYIHQSGRWPVVYIKSE